MVSAAAQAGNQRDFYYLVMGFPCPKDTAQRLKGVAVRAIQPPSHAAMSYLFKETIDSSTLLDYDVDIIPKSTTERYEMGMSPSLSYPNGGGRSDELITASGVYINRLSMTQIVFHRMNLIDVFGTYVEARNVAPSASLAGTYNELANRTNEEIHLCDLRIARLIEIDNNQRTERINDEDIPF